MMNCLQFGLAPFQLLFIRLLWLFILLIPATGIAQQQFSGQWYEVDSEWQFPEQPVKSINAPSLTGGQFVFNSSFEITDSDQTIVIDFKNASVLGHFHHYISNATGNIVAEASGGIESEVKNTFFMRHGREFKLPPGRYQLTTQLVSPYFIGFILSVVLFY